MKGFIKIIDVNQREHYLNIYYIIKFQPLGEDFTGNTIIYLSGDEKVVTLQTSTTCVEILDMVNLAIP